MPSGQGTTLSGVEGQADAGIDQGAHAARMEVRRQAQHAFGDAQILGVADQRDGLKGVGHERIPCSMPARGHL